MNSWDQLTVDERFHAIAVHHPFEAVLYRSVFYQVARKAWADLTAQEQERWGPWADAELAARPVSE